MYDNIVVGADRSETAAVAVRHAAELASRFDSVLHIVTAYRSKALDTSSLPAEFRYCVSGNEADSVLAELGSLARQVGAKVEVHSSTHEASSAILDCAQETGADLIVVGNRGMRGKGRVLGSIPNSVSHHAPCSVLIVETT
jgi:nucleotide-binding universal stress UspA family protein